MEKLAAREDLVSGEEAFQRFDALVGKVMSVPIAEIRKRDKHHKDTVHLRGKKRGPKPKNQTPVLPKPIENTEA